MDQMDRAEMSKLGEAIATVGGRITTLEKDVAVIKEDVAGIKAHYATKADVSDARTTIVMWVVGSALFAQLLLALSKLFAG